MFFKMRREDILSAINLLMDICDDPDIWEELLYLRHNQDEFSDSDLTYKVMNLATDYILLLRRKTDE